MKAFLVSVLCLLAGSGKETSAQKNKVTPNCYAYAAWRMNGGESRWSGFCQKGSLQSPVDIYTKATKEHREIVDFTFIGYKDVYLSGYDLVNNGHTLQMSLSKEESAKIGLAFEGGFYSLRRIDFHWPSEHQIDSHQYPLEAQLYHDNTMTAQVAIISVLFELNSAGSRDASGPPILRRLSQAFSEIRSTNSRARFDLVEKPEFTLTETFFRRQVTRVADGDTDGLRIHSYQGSLTRPPCTENVVWMIVETPSLVDAVTYQRFNQLQNCGSSSMTGNYRQSQPLSGRKCHLLVAPMEGKTYKSLSNQNR